MVKLLELRGVVEVRASGLKFRFEKIAEYVRTSQSTNTRNRGAEAAFSRYLRL